APDGRSGLGSGVGARRGGGLLAGRRRLARGPLGGDRGRAGAPGGLVGGAFAGVRSGAGGDHVAGLPGDDAACGGGIHQAESELATGPRLAERPGDGGAERERELEPLRSASATVAPLKTTPRSSALRSLSWVRAAWTVAREVPRPTTRTAPSAAAQERTDSRLPRMGPVSMMTTSARSRRSA